MTTEPVRLVPGPQRAATGLPLLDGDVTGGVGAPTPRRVRRTTTIDTERPGGTVGPARITLHGRDAAIEGSRVEPIAEVVASAEVEDDGTLRRLTLADGRSVPDLAGNSLRSGFTALVHRTLGAEMAERSLLASMLEDVAGAYFVSGTVLLWAGLNSVGAEAVEMASEMQADVCAGWRRGNQQHVHLLEHAAVAQPDGPPAPPITVLGGSEGWHECPDLPPNSHRRARLLDVSDLGGERRVVAHFRDSVRDESPERVLHEYGVRATVVGGGEISSIDVEAHVLPWAECPGALASAQRVVGTPVDELPGVVRRDLVGVTTCTHLNATIRSLADTAALLRLLEAP